MTRALRCSIAALQQKQRILAVRLFLCCNILTGEPHTGSYYFLLQELEDAAMKVLEDQAKIKALLEEKSAELAIIKEEYETKKKEVNNTLLH